MTVKSTILLADEQHRFAKEQVEAGRYWRSCLSQHMLVSHVCDVDIDDVRCGYLAFILNSGLPFPKAGRQAKQLL